MYNSLKGLGEKLKNYESNKRIVSFIKMLNHRYP